MKKFITLILSLLLLLVSLFSFGCKTETQSDKLQLYAPDGAPALSVARLIHDKKAVGEVKNNVVNASAIQTFVTGEKPKADFCIMPVNAAVKLLGNASRYQMLGVVTHGNLFIMKKATGEQITKANLTDLLGKKVGVINLANVPGLTFKAILNDASIEYVDITESGAVYANKVNLIALANGQAVTPQADCDYFVVPEPAATTKENATQGKLSIAGSLQELYGEGQGYPQAVLVAKKSVIQDKPEVVAKLVNSFSQNQSWLTDSQTSMNDVVNAVQSALGEDVTPTFNANNLNLTVIGNCAISFRSASLEKTAVLDYMTKINAITNGAWGTPANDFFLVG